MKQNQSKRKKKVSDQVNKKFLPSLLVLGAAGLVILAWMPVAVLTCHYVETTRVDCLLQERLVGLIPLKQIPLTGLKGAHVDTMTRLSSGWRNRPRRATVTSVILTDRSGFYLLYEYAHHSFTVGDPYQLAEQINGYVDAPPTGQPLTVWQTNWFFVGTGSCYSIFVIFIIVVATKERKRYPGILIRQPNKP